MSVLFDLDYDAAWFVPLPHDAAVREGWVQGACDRIRGSEVQDPETESALRAALEGLADLVEPGSVQFWFAPVGVFTDVLVTVDVAEVGAIPQGLFQDGRESTATGVAPLLTERHGGGYLVRRTEAVPAPIEPMLVAQWSAIVNDGCHAILVDVIGTTLPAFAFMEEQLPRLIDGIVIEPESVVVAR